MTWSRLLWMFVLSISEMFLVEPSSRLRTWTWSSWMRAVFSTMPSLAPAIFSVKNRSHSPSVNDVVQRLQLGAQVGDEVGLVVMGRYSYACVCRSPMNSARARPQTGSARVGSVRHVLRNDRRLVAYRDRLDMEKPVPGGVAMLRSSPRRSEGGHGIRCCRRAAISAGSLSSQGRGRKMTFPLHVIAESGGTSVFR